MIGILKLADEKGYNINNLKAGVLKKINEKDRFQLRDMVEREALAFAVASVDHEEIDKINILNASIKAMHLALKQLSIRPGFIIIDGNRFKPYKDIPHHCIIAVTLLSTSL